MVEVVGVRFRTAGRLYHFAPAGIELKKGDPVVVGTARGEELGWVAIAPGMIPDEEIKEPLKPVLRRASDKDMDVDGERVAKEAEALSECNQMVAKLGLVMKPVSAEYNLEGNRVTIFFTAEQRVDFRELVRELSRRLKARVELRQVGPRDETKLVGGYGRCGRPLCCASFLTDFEPVSIKMAKEQNLPLNPMKISGICGRLLCCMGYEQALYHEMQQKMPRECQRVTTPQGAGRVVATNPLGESVTVELETGVAAELPLRDIRFEPVKAARGVKPEKKAPAAPPHPRNGGDSGGESGAGSDVAAVG
ncbi:MAG: stage 0 sporulation family protein [Dehalococcoidia bacterium]|jgi:cell fate regulator YaaT (PSP1 superfamily)|nr:MAG: stage 0 sporulation family protein [Dehalococcoidia bacterium]